MDVLQQQLQQDPSLGPQMQAIEQHNQHYHQQLANQIETRNVVTIPVVFHIIHNGDPIGANENLAESLILAQLEQLNHDFALLNSDASLIPPLFQPVAANTDIQFCLAQRRPDGTPTDGINRVQYAQASWTTNQINSTLKPATIWDRNQYLNVWSVVFSSSSLLGFAQFPGGNPNTDGVVIAWYSVGSVADPHPNGGNFNKGRTLTHEVGHWLNLRHIWGDATCGNDFVDDTPVHQTSNNGCPTFPKTNNCPGGPWTEMTMNYMDYTFDACMYMFTAGQKNRMQAVVAPGGARFSLNNSLGCVPVGEVCNAPTLAQLNATNVTETSARLNCTVTGVNAYQWRYRVAGVTSWTTLPSSTALFADISNLTSTTTYEYQARVQCDTVWSAWSGSVFFTTLSVPPPPPPPPPNCDAPLSDQYSVTEITGTSARFNCTITGVSGYLWRYRAFSTTDWIELPSTTENFTYVYGLAPRTTYEMQVALVCGDELSPWSAPLLFATGTGSGGSAPCQAPAPSQLSSTDITATSATLNCSLTGVDSYSWRYRAVGAASWITLGATSAGTIALNGLSPSTTYEFQVSVQCSSGQISAWSSSQTLETLALPTCNAPAVSEFFVSDIGATSAQLNCSLGGVTSYTWQYRQVGTGSWTTLPATLEGFVVISGLSPSTDYEFQVLVLCTNGVASVWSVSQPFSTLEVTCLAPGVNQLSASSITSTTARLNCSVSGVPAYQWRYRATAAASWVNLGSTTVAFIDVTDLAPSTTYEFQAAVQCGTSWSDWSGSQIFSTLAAPACNPPTSRNMYAVQITATSAWLYNSLPGGAQFHWRYRPSGTATWVTPPSTTIGYIAVSGLTAGTTYEFQGAVSCGPLQSDWSPSVFFTTPGSTRMGRSNELEMQLWPVPAREFIHVQFTIPESALITFTALNMAGQTVLVERQGMLDAGTHTRNLDLKGLPGGVYMLQLAAGKVATREVFIVSGE